MAGGVASGRRWARVVVLAVLAVAFAVIGAAPSWAGLGGLGWGACPAGETATAPDGSKAKCTTISVPVDYGDVSKGFFEILVTALLPANLDDVKNVVLFNRGGPGGDMTGFLDSKRYPAPEELYDDNALVAIQPRGLAGSTYLTCATKAECQKYVKENPEYLESLSTENIARDMDTFRQLAGLDKISYYGASWGTELGAKYATLFPDQTDKLVLDSAIDPSAPVGVTNGNQTRAFETRLYQWFGFVAERDDKYQLGNTPLKVFRAWDKALNAASAEAGTTPQIHYLPPAAEINDLPVSLRPISAAVLPVYNAINRVYARASYVARNLAQIAQQAVVSPVAAVIAANPKLRERILSAASSDAKPDKTTNIENGATTNIYRRSGFEKYADQVSRMVNNGEPDSAFPTGSSSVGSDPNPASALQGPAVADNNVRALFDGKIRVGQLLPAFVDLARFELHNITGSSSNTTRGAFADALGHLQKFWGYGKTPEFSGKGLDVQPLVLQSDYDPATPSAGGKAMAETLNARLVTVEGGDHGVFRSNNPTVDRAVVEYLETGSTGLVRAKQAPLPSEVEAAKAAAEKAQPTSQTVTSERPAAGLGTAVSDSGIRDSQSTDRAGSAQPPSAVAAPGLKAPAAGQAADVGTANTPAKQSADKPTAGITAPTAKTDQTSSSRTSLSDTETRDQADETNTAKSQTAAVDKSTTVTDSGSAKTAKMNTTSGSGTSVKKGTTATDSGSAKTATKTNTTSGTRTGSSSSSGAAKMNTTPGSGTSVKKGATATDSGSAKTAKTKSTSAASTGSGSGSSSGQQKKSTATSPSAGGSE